MSESKFNPDNDFRSADRLEAYLDGLLDDAQAARFAKELRNDPALARQAELQSRIDGALGRLFHVETPSREAVAAALASALNPSQSTAHAADVAPLPATRSHASLPAQRSQTPTGRPYRIALAAAALAAAAAIGWLLTAPWGGAGREQPLFAARPLVEIYRDAVAHGFEPTYECKEPERFASTFNDRQRVPLRLLTPPAGTRMLGLAYVGGLSRQTTAMLCLVDGKQVMVFVDRAEADKRIAQDNSDGKLHVFREERNGLVYYEVTPFEESRVIELLAPLADASRASGAAA
jgi:hypothetical protein